MKIRIFLTGGGAKGAYQVGFFKALEELNIKYDVICGSSVGALVASAATYLTSYEMLKEKTCDKVYIVDVGEAPSSKAINTAKKVFDEDTDVTIISMNNKSSLLDFSEEQALINYNNGYEETMKVLSNKM